MTTSGQTNTVVNSSRVDLSLRSDLLGSRVSRRANVPGAQENVVVECTPTERFGLRGPGTIDWVAAQGLTIPPAVNTSAISPCGTTVMRLGQQEVLLTAPVGDGGQRLRELRQAWDESTLPAKGYDAYRDESWAWFVVSGPDAPALMRRISMADLGPKSLEANEIAQTRALHMDVVVARLNRFGAVSYDIFLDIASAKFALDVLTETAEELAVGFQVSALRMAG
ncbi:hypothetical protein V6582_01315 (plasmid) [Agrobacterium vitis]|uniref:hypothetical protein n=1 Tax=Agrobacterium vitis TaxID=373 RepID=UPI0012E71C21|nr:hypothetical protein [Agrobacterium vitis]MVA25065.1 hypothetical protein [Agrobacterium vitis]